MNESAVAPDAVPPDQNEQLEPDPLFVDALHEARWILLMWVCCFAWTLTVSLSYGYPDSVDPKTFPTVLGIPAWVAWGIAFPWLVANVVTIAFCMGYMKDADLGEEPDSNSATGTGSPSDEGATNE